MAKVALQIQRFEEFRKQALQALPELAERLFALRQTGWYTAILERDFGQILIELNDYEKPKYIPSDIIVMTNRFDHFVNDLERAEKKAGIKDRVPVFAPPDKEP